MKRVYGVALCLICQFFACNVMADSDDADKLINDYSDLIDVAVSDKPVYDYQLSDSETKILSAVKNESDRDRVVDIVGKLLDWTHNSKDAAGRDKSVTFTINYATGFLISLDTEKAYDRLLDEYEFWSDSAISGSLKYTISRIANRENFDKTRFKNILDDEAEANIENAKEHEGEKGVVLNGGRVICCAH